MDKAINNLTIPLGQLKEEILVSTKLIIFLKVLPYIIKKTS